MKPSNCLMGVVCVVVTLASQAQLVHAKAKQPVDESLQRRLDEVKNKPKDPVSHYNLGIEYNNREMLKKASKSFQKALKVNKKDTKTHADIDLDCYQILGDMAARQEAFGDAAKWFDAGLKVNPTDPMCLFRKGEAYFFDHNYKSAKKALDIYLNTETTTPKPAGDPPRALTYLGAIAMEKKKYEKAAGYFRQVIAKYPKHSKEAGTNLCIVLLTQGDAHYFKDQEFAQAAKLYDEAAKADPSNASAFKASGRAHFDLANELKDKKPPKKKKRKKNPVAGSPAPTEADYKKMALKHFEVAERNFKRADKLISKGDSQKGDFQCVYHAGLSQNELEKYDDMVNSYTRAVKLDPGHFNARYNLALSMFHANQFENALEQATQAKKLKGKDKDIVSLINLIYDSWEDDLMSKGDEAATADRFNEAIGYWEKVLELNKHHPQAPQYIEQARLTRTKLIAKHILAGDAAYKKGRLLTASNEWNAAVNLDPGNAALKKKLARVSKSKRVEAIRKQAQAAYSAGDMQTAMAKVEEALKIRSKDAATLALKRKIARRQSSGIKATLASVDKLMRTGKLMQARRKLISARQADPKNKTVRKKLVEANSRIAKAITSYKRAGAEAMSSGDKATAQREYNKVLAFNPNDAEAANAIEKLTGKVSKTAADAKKVKELNKKGIFAYMKNDLKGAETAWKAAMLIDPDNTEVKRSLARVRTKLKRIRSQST